jgi:hypothetical protein
MEMTLDILVRMIAQDQVALLISRTIDLKYPMQTLQKVPLSNLAQIDQPSKMTL